MRQLLVRLLWVAIVILPGRVGAQEYRDFIDQAEFQADDGNYDSALVLCRQALDRAIELYGPSDTAVATVLNYLGGLELSLEAVDSAAARVTQALAIRRRAFTENAPPVAECLGLLADIRAAQGEFTEADSLYSLAIPTLENNPDGRRQLAGALLGLARLRYVQKVFSESDQLFRRAGELLKLEYPEGHPKLMAQQQGLAIVQMREGMYEDAYATYENMTGLIARIRGPESEELFEPLELMSRIDRYYKRYALAEERARKCLAIGEREYGPSDEQLLNPLLTLTHVCRTRGNYTDAASFGERAAELTLDKFGAHSLAYAKALTELGTVLKESGQSQQLAPVIDQAVAIWDSLSRRDDIDLGIWLDRFSFRFRRYDPVKCLSLSRRAVDMRRNNLAVNAPRMSEMDALRFSQFTRRSASIYLTCFLDVGSEASIPLSAAAEVILQTKGMITDELFVRNHSPELFTGPMKSLSDSLELLREAMSSLSAAGSINDTLGQNKVILDSLVTEKARLETAFAGYQAEARGATGGGLPTAQIVAEALPESACLVEYYRFYYETEAPDTLRPRYVAMVIDAEGAVRAVRDLGFSDPIDSTVSRYCDHMLAASEYSGSLADIEPVYDSLAGELYEMLWQPIEEAVADADMLVVAPDGPLYLVSFAGLRPVGGRFLVEDHTVHYVTAGRELLRSADDAASGNGILAVGDPDYDASAEERAAALDSSAAEEMWTGITIAAAPGLKRNARSKCELISTLEVDRLPGTRAEIEAVCRLWDLQAEGPCESLLGIQASEDNLRQLAPGRRILHFATHGFYYPYSCVPQPDSMADADAKEFAGDSPLLRSGLFLAGSNRHGAGADSVGIHDGVLTAEEVCGFDLRGVGWVVLSACESGIGEIQAGEGIFGLRRAFEIAGARTVISSLWPVSDSKTVDFMQFLYSRLGAAAPETLRGYELQTIKRLREHGYSDHPATWAAFVSSGSPR